MTRFPLQLYHAASDPAVTSNARRDWEQVFGHFPETFVRFSMRLRVARCFCITPRKGIARYSQGILNQISRQEEAGSIAE